MKYSLKRVLHNFFEAGFRTPANMYIEELRNKGKPLKINNYINTK